MREMIKRVGNGAGLILLVLLSIFMQVAPILALIALFLLVVFLLPHPLRMFFDPRIVFYGALTFLALRRSVKAWRAREGWPTCTLFLSLTWAALTVAVLPLADLLSFRLGRAGSAAPYVRLWEGETLHRCVTVGQFHALKSFENVTLASLTWSLIAIALSAVAMVVEARVRPQKERTENGTTD